MGDTVSQKSCTRCKQIFPATAGFFGPDKRRKDGLQSHCRDCKRLANRVSRQKHKEKVNEHDRTYYWANKEKCDTRNRVYSQMHKREKSIYMKKYSSEHKEEIRKYGKNHYQKHREELCAKTRAYNRIHKEEKRKKDKIYRQTHMEAHRASNHKRYALKHGNGGSFTAADIQRKYKVQRGKCYYCHQKLGNMYHRDHVIPLARGGTSNPDNIVLTCPTCNLRKNAKLPHEWPEGGRLL